MQNNPNLMQSKIYVRITKFWWTHAKCIERYYYNPKEKTFQALIVSGSRSQLMKKLVNITENTAANLYHNFKSVPYIDSDKIRSLANVEYDAKIDADELFYYDRMR